MYSKIKDTTLKNMIPEVVLEELVVHKSLDFDTERTSMTNLRQSQVDSKLSTRRVRKLEAELRESLKSIDEDRN